MPSHSFMLIRCFWHCRKFCKGTASCVYTVYVYVWLKMHHISILILECLNAAVESIFYVFVFMCACVCELKILWLRKKSEKNTHSLIHKLTY